MGIPELTRAFNRKFRKCKTNYAIKTALTNRKIKCGRTTGNLNKGRSRILILNVPVQIKFLKTNYPLYTQKELIAKFNRRFNTTLTEQQIKSFIKNHNIRSGRTGRFSKGHVPLNKGIKGTHFSRDTEFKKGHMPHNMKPIGYERIDKRTDPHKENYIWVSVAEKNPYTGAPSRMRPKHIVVWEGRNGKVPKGMAIIFKDGDTTNCGIENLEMVSRAELSRLNQLKYRAAHPEIKPALLTMAKLKTKLFKMQRGEHENAASAR